MHAMTTITGKELNRGGGNTVCLVSMMAMVKGRWGYTSEMCNEVDCFGWWLARAHGGMAQMLFRFLYGKEGRQQQRYEGKKKEICKTGQCFLFMYLRLYCTALVVFVRVRLVGERRIDGQVDDGLQCGRNCN